MGQYVINGTRIAIELKTNQVKRQQYGQHFR